MYSTTDTETGEKKKSIERCVEYRNLRRTIIREDEVFSYFNRVVDVDCGKRLSLKRYVHEMRDFELILRSLFHVYVATYWNVIYKWSWRSVILKY